jgi:hypothetical protein
MIEEKIAELKKSISADEKVIADSQGSIKNKQKEIETLADLETRLKKIYAVKNSPDLVDSELVNTVKVIDFLEKLSGIFDFRFTYSLSDIRLSQLSISQMLYLLFGDHAETDKKSILPEEFRKKYFGE